MKSCLYLRYLRRVKLLLYKKSKNSYVAYISSQLTGGGGGGWGKEDTGESRVCHRRLPSVDPDPRLAQGQGKRGSTNTRQVYRWLIVRGKDGFIYLFSTRGYIQRNQSKETIPTAPRNEVGMEQQIGVHVRKILKVGREGMITYSS